MAYKAVYSGYKIFHDKKRVHFINGKNKRKANWMRYVNCARNEVEQNLIAYQYCGQIYYRSFKPILPETELLVYYGEEYAKELGIEEHTFKNDGDCHECEFCGIVFTGKLFLLKHLKYRHHQHVDLTIYTSKNTLVNRSLCKVVSNWNSSQENITKTAVRQTIQQYDKLTQICYRKMHNAEKSHHQYLQCGKTLTQCDDLKTHHKINTRVYQYQCKRIKAFPSTSYGNNEINPKTTKQSEQLNTQHVMKHTSNYLKYHKRIHMKVKPYQCSHCHKAFTQINCLKTHERIHTGDKPYKCSHCDKAFTNNSNLKRHERIHTGVKPYQCRHCGKAFTQNGELKRHERIHTGDKPYQCRHCGKAFTQNGELKRHERIHTGDKPYQCRHCDKAFTNNSHLKTHERIHTGVKPYQCRHCDKAFTQNSNLRTHERIHTGDTPYQCRHCDKAFTNNSGLKKHERIHTGVKPYQCRHCDKAFTQNSNLRTHERIHTGDTPYQCRHCDKAFTQNGDLNTHERIHTGDKPYQCRHCDKAFTQISTLQKHEHKHVDKPLQHIGCDS